MLPEAVKLPEYYPDIENVVPDNDRPLPAEYVVFVSVFTTVSVAVLFQ